MKKILFALLIGAQGSFLLAQNEVEPNDDFATANGLNSGMTGFGNLYQNGPTDTYDYFTFLLTENGSVDIEFIVTNESGSTLGADFVLFYSNTTQASGFNNVSVPVLETAGESFHFDCLAAGSFFIRVSASGLMDYSIEYNVSSPISITESEPNGDFVIANSMQDGSVEAGELNFYNVSADNYDFYKFTIDNYSTVDFVFEVTSTSSTNLTADFVLYDGGMGQISGFNFVTALSYQTNTESFTYPCLAPGDYYMRLEANSCMHYQISYAATSPFVATEIEPNNLFEEAMILEESVPITSYLAYSNEAYDNFDYYKFTLTEYGSIAITVNATGTSSMEAGATFVGYYGNEIGFSGFNNFSASPGQTSTTEFEFHCFAPGEYYLRFSSNTCIAYEVSYEFTAYLAPTEMEPNDSFAQATFLDAGTPQSGHIGFTDGTIDSFDYYRFTLETHGAVTITVNGYSSSSSDAFPTFVGYFGNQQQFSGFSNFNTPAGENTSTDFVFNCFAPGDYYLRFSSSGCLAYEVSYALNSPILATEVEPNNSLAEADQMQLDELVGGYVNYSNNPNYDYDDYFKVVLPDSSRAVMVCNFYETAAADNIGGSLYAYNSQGQMVGYKNVYLDDADVFTDSLAVDCYLGDTIWFRINITSCRAYDMVVHSATRKPSAEFEMDRLGNNIGFIPNIANATSFQWQFDDGQTSTSTHPLHTYAFGNWEPQLIASNSMCNFTDTASMYFEISGVESYNPKWGGRGGITSMEIFGGSLSDETVVKLIKDGVEVMPAETFANLDNNVFRANFALHEAELGFYDVEITIPGLDPILFVNGFEVQGFQYPFTTAELIGDTRALLNRDRPYKIVVTNTGNVTAEGVMVGFAAPAGVNVTVKQAMIVPPASGSITVSANNESYTLDRSEYHVAYDSAFVFYPIDSLFGEVYDGSFASFVIPNIPAGHTFELPLIVNGNSGGILDFYTFTYKPNLLSTVMMPQWYAMIDNRGMEAIKALDMDADGISDISLSEALATLEVNRGLVQAEANYASDVFWRWWDGLAVEDSTWYTLNSQIEAGITFGMKTGSELMQQQLELVTDDSVAIKNALASYFNTKTIIEGGHVLTDDWWPYTNLPEDNWWNDFPGLPQPSQAPPTYDWQAWHQYYIDYANWYYDWMNYYYQWYLYYAWQDYYNKQQKQQEIVNQNPQLLLQPFLTLQPFPGQLYPFPGYLYPFEIKKKPIVFAFSFDPNVIYGPVGVGEEQFVRSKDKQFFGVSFENLSEATASAQVVEVRDTLDLSVFDAATFEFADVMVAGNSIRVPRGRHEFVLDFYPVENVSWKVRLNGDFNDETGVIRWLLTTLDTLTESLPDFDGFLPPNVISPEGEGTVYYAVSPRVDVASGSEMSSVATIFFDLNEPIVTNTWTNIVDDQAPTSFLSASLADNTHINIQMNGTDDGCGIARYNIFISYNGQPFNLFATTEGENVELIAEPGITYGLYCEAVDSLGNGEVKEPIAEVEITTGIDEIASILTVFTIYPNPNNGQFNILPSSALQKSRLLIYNAAGAIIYEKRVNTSFGESIPIDMRDMPSGHYIIRLETPGGGFAAQRVVTVD